MKRRGVTLVELMVSAALAGIILTGVMSSFLFLSRGTVASSDYIDMDREARVALEKFARDVRMASAASVDSTNDAVTLTVEDGAPRTVNYTHVPADRTFYRNYGTPNEEVLIQGVTEFTLLPFTLIQTDATNPLETKLLQLDLTAERSGPARALATNNVISARFVMRNKIVAN